MKFTYKYQAVEPDGRLAWKEKFFPTQKALFDFLVGEKQTILAQKKAMIKRADACIFPVTRTEQIALAEKALKVTYSNDKEAGLLQRTILTNTYWWMDTLSDVHIGRTEEHDKAVFTESIKNRAHKVFPIDQHNWNLDGKIGRTIELYEAPVSWRALGVGKTGMTEGLFAVAEISKKKNERRYEEYLADEIDQHSVGMRYLDIELAVNDQDNYPKEFKVFQKYIGKIGNRSLVEGQGYFFAINEAALFEYSCVIAGANELTPVMGSGSSEKSDEPVPTKKSALSLDALIQLSSIIAE